MGFIKLVIKMVFYMINIACYIGFAVYIFLHYFSPQVILKPRAEALAYDLVDYASVNDRLLTQEYIKNYLDHELRGNEHADVYYRQRAGDRRFIVDLRLTGTTFSSGDIKVSYKGVLYDATPKESMYFSVDSDENPAKHYVSESSTEENKKENNTAALNDEPVINTENEEVNVSSETLTGSNIYIQNCASCHGQYMEGNVGPSLRNLSAKYTKEGLNRIIMDGIGTGMPASMVQGEEKDILVDWLLHE